MRLVLGKYREILAISAALLLVLLGVSYANAEDKTDQSLDEKAKLRMLKQEAANALWRLKRSVKEDGFFAARIRLNVWRNTAMDAGTFDQVQYDEFKKLLYEKSVSDSLRCFEEFLLEEDFYDANFCLQIWRMHSKELGTYSDVEYEKLKKKLREAKAGKVSGETED